MKKKIIIFIFIIILVLLFLYFRYIYGWYEFRFYKHTPKEYMNTAMVTKKDYSSDSTKIVAKMHEFIEKHEESFYSKEYYDSTQIIVDTILYSPDYKKIATVVIAKNATKRQLNPDKTHKWYYDGYLYIGNKDKDSLKLNSAGQGMRDYKEIKELSTVLKNKFFKEYSSTKDNNGNEKLYNLDDTRYWDKSIDWKNLEYNRKMQKDFEEEKLKNPKNVYEPK